MPPAEAVAVAFTLEPLGPQHAEAMFAVLADPVLYRYLDYDPPAAVEQLRATYQRLAAGAPPGSGQLWVNEVIRVAGEPCGYVQSTVMLAEREAWIAYVIGPAHQGRGLATRAGRALMERLTAQCGITRWLATAERDNRASIAVLERLGFSLADEAEHVRREASPTERLYAKPQRRA